MLKQLKRRFILSAMAAIGAVMLVVAAGINVINYSVTVSRQDSTLEGIMEYEQMKRSEPEETLPPMSEMPWADGPEADFTIRFFSAHCDEEGDITVLSGDHISSVDKNTIQEYTKTILGSGKDRGYYKGFRYMVSPDGTGTTVCFLNVSNDRRFVKSLLWVSVAIVAVSLAAVFGLIVLLSGRAIRPYVKNMERQKQFITDAGHELKTPIASIATSADILAMEHEGDEWVANIQDQTMRLTDLVSGLVQLSRLDEEMPFPEKSLFSVSDAAWEIAESFAPRANAGGKKYVQHIGEGLTMMGDRAAFGRMLAVLLDNAVRYSDEGGEIRLDVYRKYGRLCVEVFNTCDLGDTRDLDRWFDRFYRPDSSRSTRTGGSGIGLSTAQAVAAAHGGKITVSSPDGKSVLFKVIMR